MKVLFKESEIFSIERETLGFAVAAFLLKKLVLGKEKAYNNDRLKMGD